MSAGAKDTQQLLEDALTRAEGMRDWSKANDIPFGAYNKYSAVVGLIEQALARLAA